VKLLRGAKDERLARRGRDRVKTFGVLQDESEEWLMRLMRRLVSAGWVLFSGDDRPVVLLTDEGRAVMDGRSPARLLLPERINLRAPRATLRPRAAGGLGHKRSAGDGTVARNAETAASLDDAALELFEALRAYRLSVARAEAVPPFVVASDRTLRDMARVKPKSESELLSVHGMGPVKAARYGAGFLSVLQARD
jgi:ATP-dependent DNA helicase RecQ